MIFRPVSLAAIMYTIALTPAIPVPFVFVLLLLILSFSLHFLVEKVLFIEAALWSLMAFSHRVSSHRPRSLPLRVRFDFANYDVRCRELEECFHLQCRLVAATSCYRSACRSGCMLARLLSSAFFSRNSHFYYLSCVFVNDVADFTHVQPCSTYFSLCFGAPLLLVLAIGGALIAFYIQR